MSGTPEWHDCKEELKLHHRAYHAETKAFCRQKNNNDENAPSPGRAGADESGESEQESDGCTRLAFNIVVPEESPVNDKPVTEQKRRSNGTAATGEEHERVVSNWTQCKPIWRNLRTKKELNWEANDKTCRHKHLWDVNVKELLDRMAETSGSERKFG